MQQNMSASIDSDHRRIVINAISLSCYHVGKIIKTNMCSWCDKIVVQHHSTHVTPLQLLQAKVYISKVKQILKFSTNLPSISPRSDSICEYFFASKKNDVYDFDWISGNSNHPCCKRTSWSGCQRCQRFLRDFSALFARNILQNETFSFNLLSIFFAKFPATELNCFECEGEQCLRTSAQTNTVTCTGSCVAIFDNKCK